MENKEKTVVGTITKTYEVANPPGLNRINHVGDYKFGTAGQSPLPEDGEVLLYTRYKNGNLIHVDFNTIEKVVPRESYKGGTIFFKEGYTDIFYMAWPHRYVLTKEANYGIFGY